ncbi:MAG: ABC transporter permease subunit [Saprospiraceae bacterium]|nr:ABC transporter permease subunit [Saprospiraceae bacterium]
MKRVLQNPKIVFGFGFLVLPVFLFLLCIVLNLFAPEALKFPKPAVIFWEVINTLGETKVWTILGNTLLNVSIVLLIAVFLGLLFGIVLGYSNRAWNLSQPTVDFFRSIPVTFLIPASGLLLGVTSQNMIWVLASYPCMLIMILNVRAGLTKQESERVLSYSIISGNPNPIKKFFRVTIFEILPDVSTGFRIALSYSIVIVTVLEYMNIGNNGSNPGIGKLIGEEAEQLNYPRVYALIFVIGLVGFLLNKIVEILDSFFLQWSKNNSK